MRLTLQISLLVEQRLQRPGKSIAEGWKKAKKVTYVPPMITSGLGGNIDLM